MKRRTPALAIALTLATSVLAQPPQTVQDEYAVYDLLEPDTSSFRTVYEVSVTTPGATAFADGIGNSPSLADSCAHVAISVANNHERVPAHGAAAFMGLLDLIGADYSLFQVQRIRVDF